MAMTGKITTIQKLYNYLNDDFKNELQSSKSSCSFFRLFDIPDSDLLIPLVDMLISKFDVEEHFIENIDNVDEYAWGVVPTTYFQFIENIDNVDEYAWGAALLSFLHYGIEKMLGERRCFLFPLWDREESMGDKGSINDNLWVVLDREESMGDKGSINDNLWVVLSFFLIRIKKLRDALGIELNLKEALGIELNLKEDEVPLMSMILKKVRPRTIKKGITRR
ncbi:hypothetical protein PHJA_002672500 [Phtheirospermum japonicum]|uniref:Uncharacterized protein n=1 Tax=Phtheirospermum japonicum TaxID=374723 RepID=A0A830DAW7_9LAMI|nr:hypothetical protein PHJA_002672500 [Phtheirospermum japonicum]